MNSFTSCWSTTKRGPCGDWFRSSLETGDHHADSAARMSSRPATHDGTTHSSGVAPSSSRGSVAPRSLAMRQPRPLGLAPRAQRRRCARPNRSGLPESSADLPQVLLSQSDSSCLPSPQGLYLAAVIDLYSRQVVGWAMSDRMKATLICDALTMALFRLVCPTASRQPGQSLGLATTRERGDLT